MWTDPENMIHLALLGPHSRLCSSLCAACPHGPAGCCTSPPPLDWSDIGRIVSLGGRDFVLEHLHKGNLTPAANGLHIRRVRRRESPDEPIRKQCVFFGKGGCTIAPDRRPATCNYYLCDDAYVAGGERREEPSALIARKWHDALREHYARWDDELSARVRGAFPEGPPWDAAFLDWLGQSFKEIACAPDLSALSSGKFAGR